MPFGLAYSDYISQRGTSRSLLAKQAHKCDLAICNSRSVEEDFLRFAPDFLAPPYTMLLLSQLLFQVPQSVPYRSRRDLRQLEGAPTLS